LTTTQGSRSRTAPPPIKPGPPPGKHLWIVDFYRSAVGKKWVMAVTGIVLLGYVVVHMAGNLKLYLGAESINHYGEFLREMGEPIFPRTNLLWILRAGLTLAFALHVHAAFALTLLNRRARPQGYRSQRDYLVANYASRTMIWSGVIVLLFLAFHLADLTWGFANPDFVRGDPYGNLVASFSRVPVALLYIAANVALGFHIFHGAWSLFQSIGANNPRFNHWRRYFAVAVAAVVVVGNVSFPIAVMTGVVS
jgi:succinate dehydrogenase / fumarate reductase, cytochrome b subunit